MLQNQTDRQPVAGIPGFAGMAKRGNACLWPPAPRDQDFDT